MAEILNFHGANPALGMGSLSLITFYPERVKDSLKEVEATSNEKFYKNVEMMADKISVDNPEVEKRKVMKKRRFSRLTFCQTRKCSF